MIREIYIRNENDPYFEGGIIDYSNEMENIISQIRMLLGTQPGQVLGEYEFGIDLYYAVHNTKASASELKAKIDEKIDLYVKHSDKITITSEVNFGKSESGYDYAVIDIYVNGGKAIGFLIDQN